MIKKTSKGFFAATSKGQNLSKKPKTKIAAERQLRAVEANKGKGKSSKRKKR